MRGLMTYWSCIKKSGGEQTALDLGCGLGANSVYSAKKGFQVTGVDMDDKLLAEMSRQISQNGLSKLIEIISINIEDFKPKNKYSIILALSVLNFFKLKKIENILATLKKALNKNGIMFLRVLNNKDESYKKFSKKGMTVGPNEIFSPKLGNFLHYFDRAELVKYLSGLEILDIQEYERTDNHLPEGEHKHYLFDVIVKKPVLLNKQ